MLRFGLWAAPAALAGLGLALAACSSGGAGLTTASILGGGPKVEDPAGQRALHVAATSARATRCGYIFDPARLRTAYLAHESTQGGASDQLARLEKTYDFTRSSIATKIAASEDYCTDDQAAKIKRDLMRHMAGDFSPPPKAAEPPGSGGWFGSSASSNNEFDRNKIFDPMARRP